MSDVIDLNAERNKRRPDYVEHVTRVVFAEMFFGTSEGNEVDPPMVMLGCYGGALVFEEDDARMIAAALVEHADVLKAQREGR